MKENQFSSLTGLARLDQGLLGLVYMDPSLIITINSVR